MPEFRIYEFRTPNNNGGPNWRDKVVEYLPKIGIFLIALVLLSLFTNLLNNPLKYLIGYPIFIMSLVLHEMSHAYMADFLGDPTPRLTGRLSFNPMKHLDLMGTLMFIVCGFGWAKPVQVDSNYFKKPDRAMVSVALAGPLCNFLLAVISAIVLRIIFFLTRDQMILNIAYSICYAAAQVNILLAVFNLIPVPPLDGSRLVHYMLPAKYKYKYYQFAQQYSFLLFILLFLYAGKMIAPIVEKAPIQLFNLMGLHFY